MKTQNTIITLALFITGFSFGQNTFPTTGNVGIGTTTPGVAVQIEKFAPGIIDILRIKNGYATTSASHGASIVLDGYYSQSKISSYENAQNTLGGNLQLQTYNGSGVLNTGIILNRLGNVGIGTTTPSAKLESYNAVAGVTSFKAFGVNGYLLVDNLGSGENYYSANKFHDFQTAGGSSKMRINELGNVGIGTQTPSAKLHINNGDNSYGAILATSTGNPFALYTKSLVVQPADVESFRLGMKYDTDERNGFISFYRGGSTDGGFLGFSTNGVERMRLDRSGNVGIGTQTPTEKLEIAGNTKVNGNLSIGKDTEIATLSGPTNSGAIQIKSHSALGGATNRYLRLGWKDNLNVFRSALAINDDLKVGIGTLNPDAELTVNGQIHTKEVRIDLAGALAVPDYVFANDYQLKTLNEVDQYIQANSHLPEIPSANEMVKNGMLVSEMNLSLLKKIEELTLYAIEQQKKLDLQNKAMELLSDRLSKLEKK